MKNYFHAWDTASQNGVKFDLDFHQQSLSSQGLLHDLAKDNGYRRPKNANGSLARYFFALLNRRYGNNL